MKLIFLFIIAWCVFCNLFMYKLAMVNAGPLRKWQTVDFMLQLVSPILLPLMFVYGFISYMRHRWNVSKVYRRQKNYIDKSTWRTRM